MFGKPKRDPQDFSDEIQAHIQLEAERLVGEGLERDEAIAAARRAFGNVTQTREQFYEASRWTWLDALRADLVFGWRQLMKRKVASATAIVSLALATGACTSAFRLIDALLLRPLPVAEPQQLFYLNYPYTDRAGLDRMNSSFDHPTFLEFRSATEGLADLIAISAPEHRDFTFASDLEIEKGRLQFVSGGMFRSFGLKPALGRLLNDQDDITPGAHPVVVLSHGYWTRRFGQDSSVLGDTFRMTLGRRTDVFEIVGVAEEGFTGTEPGTLTDMFIPTMMQEDIVVRSRGFQWFRAWVRLNEGVSQEAALGPMQPIFAARRKEQAKKFPWPPERITAFVNRRLSLEPAAAGVSRLQNEYRNALVVLGVVVALVLLIACANVSNLMTAQAAGRAREMALRVSIGAGRRRLVQLVAIESLIVGLCAAVLGGLFAWWSAPFVAGMINPLGRPVQLILPIDWRVAGFATALTLIVTVLFGMAPALRASMVRPVSALKGGLGSHPRSRLMYSLVASQVAFCIMVQFAGGLFVSSFERLSNQPTGFRSERLLAVEIATGGPQPQARWSELTERLSNLPGVESAALSSRPLMQGGSWSQDVWVGGQRHSPVLFLAVSPDWIETMGIPFVQGRDLRVADTHPGTALVNEVFARYCIDGGSPVGRSFEMQLGRPPQRTTIEIVGQVGDARYRNMRDDILPTVYVPLGFNSTKGARTTWPRTLVVQTQTDDPMVVVAALRREVAATGFGFRVADVRTQDALIRQHTIRERLLATLSVFFGIVALLLAAIGFYGVLSYVVGQQRREIGIRIALGARASHVARGVAGDVVAMVAVGTLMGLAAGVASARYIESLLYDVSPMDMSALILPALLMLTAVTVAAVPPVLRATRIDPASMLRTE